MVISELTLHLIGSLILLIFTLKRLGYMSNVYAIFRDALLATLLDSVRGSGNHDVHVKMQMSSRGKRWGPLTHPLEQDVESLHLKFFQQRPGNRSLAEIIERFNANVPYSGLIHSVTQDVRNP